MIITLIHSQCYFNSVKPLIILFHLSLSLKKNIQKYFHSFRLVNPSFKLEVQIVIILSSIDLLIFSSIPVRMISGLIIHFITYTTCALTVF